MPKELLPIVDKPLIQYAAEEAIAAGIDTLIFVTGRNKRAIEDHFDANNELETMLRAKGIRPCIPGRKSRSKAVRYDKRRYKRRNRIEIMFGRLKDWRRVATRYDRCPKVFLSAIALAATVIYWL